MATPRTADGTSSKTTAGSADTSRTAAVGDAVAEAAGTVRTAAEDAVARLPDVAATTRLAIEDANRQMRSGSDERNGPHVM